MTDLERAILDAMPLDEIKRASEITRQVRTAVDPTLSTAALGHLLRSLASRGYVERTSRDNYGSFWKRLKDAPAPAEDAPSRTYRHKVNRSIPLASGCETVASFVSLPMPPWGVEA